MNEHLIHTGGDGRLLGAGGGPATDADLARLRETVAAALAHERIVLHIHGGLVDARSGTAGAQRLVATYTDAGAYPLFFVWRSGAVETVRHNLLEIAREEIFDRLVRRVLSWAVGAVRGDGSGGRSAGAQRPDSVELDEELLARRRMSAPEQGREPFARDRVDRDLGEVDEAAFLADVESDPELRAQLAGVLADRPTVGQGGRGGIDAVPVPSRMDDAVLAEIVDDQGEGGRDLVGMAVLARKALAVLRAVLARYRGGTDHGVYPTVVEEVLRAFYLADLGGALWSTMKRDTLDAFAPGPDRAARLVMEQISAALASGASRARVTLVGHSTGAVFIDNFLSAAAPTWPATTPVQVCFLAPAATSERFAAALDDAEKIVGRFRMFTMTDDAERADRLVGGVYPRSLLYLVSGLLEREQGSSAVVPVVGLARYLTADPAPLRVRDYLREPGRVVLSPTTGPPVDGAGTTATTHGGFDDDAEVLRSLAYLIGSW